MVLAQNLYDIVVVLYLWPHHTNVWADGSIEQPCRLCVDDRQCDRDWRRTKLRSSCSCRSSLVSPTSQLRAEETTCRQVDRHWKGLFQLETGCPDEAGHPWPSGHDHHPPPTSWTATRCPPANSYSNTPYTICIRIDIKQHASLLFNEVIYSHY